MTTTEATRITVPAELEERLDRALGRDDSLDWAARAEATVKRLLSAWTLKPTGVVPSNTMALAVEVTDINGTSMVLKVPTTPAMGRMETDALGCWAEAPVPAVRRIDEESGAWLMEHLVDRPRRVNAVHAHVLASLLQRPAPPANGFPHVWESLEWRMEGAVSRNDRGEHPGRDQLDAAIDTIANLLDTTEDQVLLHGDYQSKNILFTAAGPHAIDPIPCIGDRHYDMALWVATADHSIESILTAADLSGDTARFAAWAWALAVIEQRHGADTGRISQLEIMARPWISAVVPLAA